MIKKIYKLNKGVNCGRNSSSVSKVKKQNPSSEKGDGFFNVKKGGEKMKVLNPVGLIEDVHGHKGTVRIRPLTEDKDKLGNLSCVYITDSENKRARHEVHEVRKYRRNTYLLKFKGLKWRNEVEGMVNCTVAV